MHLHSAEDTPGSGHEDASLQGEDQQCTNYFNDAACLQERSHQTQCAEAGLVVRILAQTEHTYSSNRGRHTLHL